MNAVFLPNVSNPYPKLLAGSLAKHNVSVTYGQAVPPVSWLIKNRGRVNVLHIHWPHALYRQGVIALNFFLFAVRLCAARLMGYKIVWTAHNILPHEKTYALYDIAARYLIIGLANHIIAHCGYARRAIAERFHRKKNVHVIPHGNYINHYPVTLSAREARERLKVPEGSFVYLFFGQIRPYKGLQNLIRAFKQLRDEKAVLLIAGKCSKESEQELLHQTGDDPRIITDFRHIPDNELSRYFMSADILVAPYADILTSGSVLLAFSFGLPVIAPARGCIPELVSMNSGIVYDPSHDNSLLSALKSIQARDTAAMGREAYHTAQKLDWNRIAYMTLQIYQK